jgi:NADH:ubiquinone reductase (H+-translocating)
MMRKRSRHTLVGAAAGLLSGLLVSVLFNQFSVQWLISGAIAGALFGFCFPPEPDGHVDSVMIATALGVPAWVLITLIVRPVLSGKPPAWTLAGMQAAFPELAGWLVFGLTLGLLSSALSRFAGTDELVAGSAAPKRDIKHRVLILGGGFAGLNTAEQLEHIVGADPSIEITLVNETNALLFTPMLAEVAASSLEPTHISTPLRTSLRRTDVVCGKASRIDLFRNEVTLFDGRRTWTQPYTQLVLSLGAVSNYLGLTRVQQHAFDFKSLGDAIRIRNHVIRMFEQANRAPDRAERRALLTFVIAGAGFAGAELAGGLNDFARGMVADFPNLSQEDVQILVIHPRDSILPELSQPLAAYALERMRARGVTFLLNTRLADAEPDKVTVKRGDITESIPAHTLVWTVGTTPNPLLATLPEDVGRDRRGAVKVHPTLAVPEHPGLWAIGDCAAVPDILNGQDKTCPPTAQFAIRQAKTLAHNIHATTRGRALKPFSFKALGLLAVVGHHTACAELAVPFTKRTVLFSGLLAWLMWRGVYLGKLPGLERKVRVLSDWVIELFFPRDIAQTID